MELTLFRIVQECLTNVHRHSGARIATIRVVRDTDVVQLEVRDQGKGIPPERLEEIRLRGSGVGLRGIRERLAQFQGDMKIESNGSGTTVFACIPIPKKESSADLQLVQSAVRGSVSRNWSDGNRPDERSGHEGSGNQTHRDQQREVASKNSAAANSTL